ncbi:hypothetical protein [Secundilactobacillus malefermentans]|uniref:Lipoprotein n=1 Tax=Secundilactobacillus malefermentans TaxID=176292 RepID=A0A4R5NSZ9_9LACO|nr:hypothetical protein [Secundilactobacillus malefermentans]TDG79913.1 hypothetical protein C5L31_002132 [Secundilactobacillus malefermentans]
MEKVCLIAIASALILYGCRYQNQEVAWVGMTLLMSELKEKQQI